MLKIKLARFGKKDQPHYRIVVTEARSKRDGKYVESIGHYAPSQTTKILEVNIDAYNGWIAKGAQPTPTVDGLVKRFQTGSPFPAKPKALSKKAKAKQEAEAESTETALDQAEETKPEETSAETTEEITE